MRRTKGKRLFLVMFIITVLFISAPAIIGKFKIIRFSGLKGTVEKVPKPELSFATFYDMSFQDKAEKYVSQNFGFREPVIRFYNQIIWELFHKTYNDKVSIGKERWLYEPWYVDEYFGTINYLDDTIKLREEFDRQSDYIYQISSILNAYETKLIVLMVPGKPQIYPEYLPEHKGSPDSVTIRANDYYTKKFEELGIDHINYTEWFVEQKEADSFLLFPQTGTHWSNTASLYAMDSLIKYMEATSGINMHNLSIGKLHARKTAKTPDDDLEQLLNLMHPIKKDAILYADVDVISDSTAYRPNILVIGDSYFWNMDYSVPLDELFNRHPFWYYNSKVYFDENHTSVKDLNMVEELIRSDFVILLFSAYPMYYFSCNFAHNALLKLYVSPETIDSLIEEKAKSIRKQPKYMDFIIEKAAKSNSSIESAIYNDAKYLVFKNPENIYTELKNRNIPQRHSSDVEKYYYLYKDPHSESYIRNRDSYGDYIIPDMETRIEEVIKSMKRNPEWMNTLQEKARRDNISLEEAMYQDAKWIIKKRNKQ